MGNSGSTTYDGGEGNKCSLVKNNPDLTGSNTVCQNWLRMQKFILKNTLPPGPEAKPEVEGELIIAGLAALAVPGLGELYGAVAVGELVKAGLELGAYYANIEYPDDWAPDPKCKNKTDEDGNPIGDCSKQLYPPGWSQQSVKNASYQLCPYPDNLFVLWRSDCIDSKEGKLQTFIDNTNYDKPQNENPNKPDKIKKSFLDAFPDTKTSVNPEEFWNGGDQNNDDKHKVDCTLNPFACIANLAGAVTKNGNSDYNYACRWLNPEGEYCRTEPFSLTANRRAAAWGCGIASLIGLNNVGVCNQNYNYEGLSDFIDDIEKVKPEFESLTYLCMGTQLSAVQCKLLKNFSTQDAIFKTAVLEREKLLQSKLDQPLVTGTITLIIVLLIITFLSIIKVLS